MGHVAASIDVLDIRGKANSSSGADGTIFRQSQFKQNRRQRQIVILTFSLGRKASQFSSEVPLFDMYVTGIERGA